MTVLDLYEEVRVSPSKDLPPPIETTLAGTEVTAGRLVWGLGFESTEKNRR